MGLANERRCYSILRLISLTEPVLRMIPTVVWFAINLDLDRREFKQNDIGQRFTGNTIS